jgi:hypothetical protein
MHTDYKVDGANKRAAYQVLVRDGAERSEGIIYVTEYLDFRGVRFFCLKEGYSILLVMSDLAGPEICGAHVPLQSYRQEPRGYRYASGNADGPLAFPFPPPPEQPRVGVQMSYTPGQVERQGLVGLQVHLLAPTGSPGTVKSGEVPVGGSFDVGPIRLEPREVRYWVGMNVRYDPGLVVILTSLCCGLGGMVVTLVGRLRQGSTRKQAA